MPSSASVPLLGQPTGSRQRSLDDRWDGFKAWLHEQGAKIADKWEATKDYGKSLTPFQRGLAIAGIVIIVLLLIPYSIAVYLIYHPPVHGPGSPISVPPPAPKSPLCVSPDCVLAAASILPSLNTSVDPCDDFYEFTCGNWLYSNPIADQEVSVSTWTEIRDRRLERC
ncbi:hypothetical protein DFJ73DRAFT_496044 [Zopfochytrium polystomum]|nr:hypothetical protein DFJ73DRAFT_496044 [Zopfochytrium polystomum]